MAGHTSTTKKQTTDRKWCRAREPFPPEAHFLQPGSTRQVTRLSMTVLPFGDQILKAMSLLETTHTGTIMITNSSLEAKLHY